MVVRDLLPGLIGRYELDLVIANGENAAGGLGLTIEAAQELFRSGVDVLTSGNHIFRHREIYEYLEHHPRLIRPANYPSGAPGRGALIHHTAGGVAVGVINVMGRTYMEPLDCPFRGVDTELKRLNEAGVRVVVVDFHAEATSEKRAMAYHLDGRVSVLVGTHTHVQTADEEILSGKTGYITDLGMTGPRNSVIGMKWEGVLERFISGRPVRFEVAKKGLRLEGVVVEVDEASGASLNIVRIQVVTKN
jgi:hypothetical protein